MSEYVDASQTLSEFIPFSDKRDRRTLFSFDLEITARCNNDCKHCYINLPAGEKTAKEQELTLTEIKEISSEAVSLGALWCLITGGEPLLRKDFSDIYLSLKKSGLLVSVFTNANLITEEHVKLFKKYPPRDIEVSVYGVTKNTYERVTRKPGSFEAFMRGLDLLFSNGIKVRLKAMALRSNLHEMPQISSFCRERTLDYYRFDPQLHLRYDGYPIRNEEIRSERLTADEIVALERSDEERFNSLKNNCDLLIVPEFTRKTTKQLLGCGAGTSSIVIGYDGRMRLCSSLWHPSCLYDLRNGSLSDAWNNFIPRVRELQSDRREFLQKCRICPLINLCLWCPAHAYLETGEMDVPVDYFCAVAHARAKALGEHF